LTYGWSQSALFLPFRRGILVVWGVSGVVVPRFSTPFFFLIQKYVALLRIQEKKKTRPSVNLASVVLCVVMVIYSKFYTIKFKDKIKLKSDSIYIYFKIKI
jgi:hypothetical protein